MQFALHIAINLLLSTAPIMHSIWRALALVCLVTLLPSPITFAASSATLPSTRNEGDGKHLVVRIPRSQAPSVSAENYYERLLSLALEKTSNTDGPFLIVPLHQSATSKRLISQLSGPDNSLDVIWTTNNKEREEVLRPIKISILRGLNSYRMLLIRKGEQSRFNQVNTLKDLSLLAAGQGAHWTDTSILLANGLPVISAPRGDLLFDMLKQKRFDYFPRGLYEIWDEQRSHAGLDIVIEEGLMLHYPSPIYFFVNKTNVALADRIERGLHIAQRDGSFDELFFSFKSFKKGYEQIKRKTRKVLELKVDFPEQD